MQKGNISGEILGLYWIIGGNGKQNSPRFSSVRVEQIESEKDRQIEWSEDTHTRCRVSLGGNDLMRLSHRGQRATVFTITQWTSLIHSLTAQPHTHTHTHRLRWYPLHLWLPVHESSRQIFRRDSFETKRHLKGNSSKSRTDTGVSSVIKRLLGLTNGCTVRSSNKCQLTLFIMNWHRLIWQ